MNTAEVVGIYWTRDKNQNRRTYLSQGIPTETVLTFRWSFELTPLQHIRLFGIIGLLPPWPLMVPFNCHQSQRSPLFFHLVRKKTLKRKNTLVNSVGYDKPCSFTREDDKSFSTNNCVHRIDSRWHYPTTIQQINGPKRSKVSTITQLTRLKCKKRKERRSNILSNNDNAPNTKKNDIHVCPSLTYPQCSNLHPNSTPMSAISSNSSFH